MKTIISITKNIWLGKGNENPEPEEIKVEGEKGTELSHVLPDYYGSSILIKEVYKDYILLVTSKMAPRDADGINLREDFTNLETIIYKNESASFATQTMDSGIIIDIFVEDIIE